jgi:hypothetical protein
MKFTVRRLMISVAIMAILIWSTSLALRWLEYRRLAVKHEQVCDVLRTPSRNEISTSDKPTLVRNTHRRTLMPGRHGSTRSFDPLDHPSSTGIAVAFFRLVLLGSAGETSTWTGG